MEDKRKDERFDIQQMIEISKNSKSFQAEGVNISKSGLLVRIDREIEAGKDEAFLFAFDIEFEEGTEKMRCEGKIVYTQQRKGINNAGIQFVALNEKEEKILEKYIKFLDEQSS